MFCGCGLDGGDISLTANFWPLHDTPIQEIILDNVFKLVEMLAIDADLIGHMSATSCFSRGQIEDLKECTKRSDRNRKLLDMLSRRSVDHFNQFIGCLQKTQPHLVHLFSAFGYPAGWYSLYSHSERDPC